ncbi:MAG: PKD domain-containing protein [Pirellulales bacterium]|mgnify:FL=1|jgi:TolA-binding protein|nr:PKD domain-containing protein [Thermoguttaceae bacterium]MDD4786560.1 PKD domain-containing protein [Pirellulales bacterium]NLZ01239.1 PKD domain-containing protein [Pirellulaceae bacterium]
MPILPARIVRLAVVAGLFLSGVAPAPAVAQTYRHAGTEFEAVRRVVLPEDKSPAIAVTEFHHHGQIDRDGVNVLALTADRRPQPTRVLQLGPGDFCRVAFETDPRQREYFVFYGGKPPKPDDVPPWTRTDGLLLEARQYRQCNLNSFESVKQAFESSEPIGSDYVDAVRHAGNPFLLGNPPFLSRYSGTFELAAQGRYGFFTSSEDCSFLLIDGELVVAAPGRHGPERRALPGNRKEVELSAGRHTFEYYHAASGPSATMVAAWETNPGSGKPAPGPIPPAVFRADAVAHLPAQPAETRQEKLVPNFTYMIRGSVPLPDNPQHLVGVEFQNASAAALLTKSKLLWEFGDGQTSELPNPVHVYLRPGLYSVKLSIQRGVKRVDITHQLHIDEPNLERPKEVDDLDKYLPIVESYAPEKLDAASLRQLILAFLWKAEQLAEQLAEQIAEPKAGEEPPGNAQAAAETPEARAARSRGYLARAVAAGKAALLGESAAAGDAELFKLAQIVGPAARDQLGESLLAGQIWSAASRKIARPEYRAECQLRAADIALNDLLNPQGARPLLESAANVLGQAQTGALIARVKRVWGDYHAATGDGAQARQAYIKAERVLASPRPHVEQIAWQGAYSRSTEQFLIQGDYARAARELRAWQEEFPTEKIRGYLHLLFARYWAGRENHAAAVAQSEQLLAVNPASAYADQLLLLAAECEEKLGRRDRALATLHALVRDYPGSPLVAEAKEIIARIESPP